MIHDSDYHPTETLTSRQILAQSSNVGAVKIGQQSSCRRARLEPMYDWIRRFGFGSPTGVDLPGEEQGIVPRSAAVVGLVDRQPPDRPGRARSRRCRWRPHTPRSPTAAILRRRTSSQSVGGVPTPSPAGHRIFSRPSPTSCAGCSRACFGPTRHRRARSRSPATSSPARPGRRTRSSTAPTRTRDYVASFVGFAPASDPQIEAIVLVDQPSTGFVYGTEVAAPAWKQIMDFALPYLKIPHSSRERSP